MKYGTRLEFTRLIKKEDYRIVIVIIYFMIIAGSAPSGLTSVLTERSRLAGNLILRSQCYGDLQVSHAV